MTVFTHALATDNYGPAKFIVSPFAYNGTHTTIQSAVTAASAGDTIFVRDGIYTENITLKPGINIVAFSQNAFTPNVTINGQLTYSAAGTVTISDIRFVTNSTFFLIVSGSSASIIFLNNCFFNCTNNTGISFTSSNAGALIQSTNCDGNIGATGISLFSQSSVGTLTLILANITNTGASTTPSTASAGNINIDDAILNFSITTSGTAGITTSYSQFSTGSNSCLIVGGSGLNSSQFSSFSSGTASSISVGTGATLRSSNDIINSSNTNAITGLGTFQYGLLSFVGTSKTINTTTQTPLLSGTFTPAIAFGGSSTGITYSFQSGFYARTGNVINFSITIALTSKGAQTGNATLTGLPFVQGANGEFQYFSIPEWTNFSPTATYTSFYAVGEITTSIMDLFQFSPTLGGLQLTNAQFSNTSSFNLTGAYLII